MKAVSQPIRGHLSALHTSGLVRRPNYPITNRTAPAYSGAARANRLMYSLYRQGKFVHRGSDGSCTTIYDRSIDLLDWPRPAARAIRVHKHNLHHWGLRGGAAPLFVVKLAESLPGHAWPKLI